MTSDDMNPNSINSNWVGSTRTLIDVNPSDLDDVVGRYAEASTEQAAYARVLHTVKTASCSPNLQGNPS